MMEGFGIHTFRFVNAKGNRQFRQVPLEARCLGCIRVLWDEAQKISGNDPDFHRRDLWEAIEDGDFPEWELGVQIVEEKDEHTLRLRSARPDQTHPGRTSSPFSGSAG